MKNLDNNPINLFEPAQTNIPDLPLKTLLHDHSKFINLLNQTTQNLFNDRSEYQKLLTYLSQKQGLSRLVLPQLVLFWIGDKDDTLIKIFNIAFVHYLRRVHQQLSSLSAIQRDILDSFWPTQTCLHSIYTHLASQGIDLFHSHLMFLSLYVSSL